MKSSRDHSSGCVSGPARGKGRLEVSGKGVISRDWGRTTLLVLLPRAKVEWDKIRRETEAGAIPEIPSHLEGGPGSPQSAGCHCWSSKHRLNTWQGETCQVQT